MKRKTPRSGRADIRALSAFGVASAAGLWLSIEELSANLRGLLDPGAQSLLRFLKIESRAAGRASRRIRPQVAEAELNSRVAVVTGQFKELVKQIVKLRLFQRRLSSFGRLATPRVERGGPAVMPPMAAGPAESHRRKRG